MAAWIEAHQAGVNAFHADPDRHAAWIEALQDRWGFLRANLEAMAAWIRAHQAGVKAFHADPVRHAAWQRAISEAHLDLWRDPMFILNRGPRCWYKTREVPGLKNPHHAIIVAGWEPRTILMFVHLFGFLLSSLRLDDRTPVTPPVLRQGAPCPTGGKVDTFRYDYNGGEKNYIPDQAHPAGDVRAMALLVALGVLQQGQILIIIILIVETKCGRGARARGDWLKDCIKGIAVANSVEHTLFSHTIGVSTTSSLRRLFLM
jgi:hypothetical protein